MGGGGGVGGGTHSLSIRVRDVKVAPPPLGARGGGLGRRFVGEAEINEKERKKGRKKGKWEKREKRAELLMRRL